MTCLSPELMKLASEYSASVTFFDHAQKNLRKIYSDCSYEKECFETNAFKHIESVLCPLYEDYNFVSKSECERAGQNVMDLVIGNKELAIPIRNTAQDAHNERMYDLERGDRVEECRELVYNMMREGDAGFCYSLSTTECVLKECYENFHFHNDLKKILRKNKWTIKSVIEDNLGCQLTYKSCERQEGLLARGNLFSDSVFIEGLPLYWFCLKI